MARRPNYDGAKRQKEIKKQKKKEEKDEKKRLRREEAATSGQADGEASEEDEAGTAD